MKLFALNIEQVLNIYELSPLEEDFVLGERGDRVGNYNDYPRSAITWMTKRRVIQ